MTLKNIVVSAFLCLGFFIVHAQMPVKNYERNWQKVDSLINKKGLPASALQEVNNIYSLAKKDNNEPQLIKALVFRINLQNVTQEEAGKKSITDLAGEIAPTHEPETSILNSMLAETYLNYFRQNRYRMYNRTATVDYKNDDVATWSARDFHNKISSLYLASLRQEKLLKETLLEPYNAILIPGNSRQLRPTLFDLLANRALDYFRNDETRITDAADNFELDNPAAFSDAATFAGARFATTDSAAPQYRALLLYQELIRFHLRDTRPDALLDADLNRLVFAEQHSILDNKETVYAQALAHITDQFGTAPVSAQAWYLRARIYANKASSYNPATDTANRYAYLQAKALCEKGIFSNDSSEGGSNCRNLVREILQQQLSLQTEKVNVPGQSFRTLVNYRNITQVSIRLIKMDHVFKESLGNNQWQDGYWTKLLKAPALRSFTQTLPETGDYQKHAVEIKTDALPAGEYALLASPGTDFNSKSSLSVFYFYVSNIAYINNDLDYFVLNRESGQPHQYATVQVWNKRYDSKTGIYRSVKAETYQTDIHGYFQLKKRSDDVRNGQLLEISTASDHLFIDELENYYPGYRAEEDTSENRSRSLFEKNHLKTFLFTDRSIYRPGQAIYFKGIVLTNDFDSKHPKIIPAFKTKVILYDADEEKVDSLLLTTNEFGSYNGRFTLPENLLNGEFKITDDSSGSEQAFSVEEYKRPKFHVEYDIPKNSYRVNDTIRVTGSAVAYAGNNLNDAPVKYRVVRMSRFPYPWLYGRWGMPLVSAKEIAHGEIKTDAQGKFTIPFTAIPDAGIARSLEPVFDYQVSADITDINGETRSGEITIPAGYKSLNLSITLPDGSSLAADSLKSVSISTENLAGQFKQTTVQVTLTALQAPDRLIRERYWPQPDQFVLDKETYLKEFPYDEYADETRKETWKRTGKVFESSALTTADRKFNIDHRAFPAGWYVLEVTAKDSFGEPVRDLRYLELYDSKSGAPASPQYNWASEKITVSQPGSQAVITIGSSAANVFVIQQVDHLNASQTTPAGYSFFSLDRQGNALTFPVSEADRGGFGVYHAFIKHNRFFSMASTVYVPWTNKELNIKYETFRDKTLPGSRETWKIKISGYKRDAVAAEVLAGMYDASLDQFKTHSWNIPDIYPNYFSRHDWGEKNNFSAVQSMEIFLNNEVAKSYRKIYDRLIGVVGNDGRAIMTMRYSSAPRQEQNKAPMLLQSNAALSEVVVTGFGRKSVVSEKITESDTTEFADSEHPGETKSPVAPAFQPRKNFNETAFFFPDLKTDTSGNISFSFTMPEALTEWKWMSLAHTKDLSFAYAEKNIITQKQLMVQPNAPRFLREGDHIDLTTKIVNLTDSEMTGQVELQLIDATTNEPVDGWFQNMQANQYFTVPAKQSEAVSFPLQIPYQFNKPLTYRIIAHTLAGNAKKPAGVELSDGEESVLPVLSNRMLVTETLPLNMRGGGTKKYSFEKLLQSGSSETLNHHGLTIEFTSNPAWYAVQALPYLMEYPYECAEQTFNRYYANALASKIANSSPRIRAIFDSWKTADTSALLSNLQKNQELKSVLLQETPWVLQAKTESEQKKNIALLFSLNKMNKELESALSKLADMQSSGGGFSWFKGGPDDRYITQYILSGIGHLRKLGALPASSSIKTGALVKSAIAYLDRKINEDYMDLKRARKSAPIDGGLGYTQIQYLYTRSFFNEYPLPGGSFDAVHYYRRQSQQHWLQQNEYAEGMIALSLFRTGDIQKAKDILASLKQRATINQETGMYWKDVQDGYYWYQAPVETQALMVEAYQEITKDAGIVNNLKTNLLKQKQTQSWTTTKATADACYALLLQGADWLADTPSVQIILGDKTVTNNSDTKPEAGTGYFKTRIDGPFVKPSLGNISITIPPSANTAAPSIAWGAVYWQYFENLDRITPAATPLQVTKKLFVEKNTNSGPVLEAVSENGTLHPGDKIKVRIELRVDRNMEYVHLKDMRASCMEPVNVLSGYAWQGGLGYYQSTKDASANFFFSDLPKGTYVFEYPLFVTSNGNFSNGVTTIQCMYAPEFSAHSEGIRVNVEPAP